MSREEAEEKQAMEALHILENLANSLERSAELCRDLGRICMRTESEIWSSELSETKGSVLTYLGLAQTCDIDILTVGKT